MTDAERGKVDPLFLANEILDGLDFQPYPHKELFKLFPECDPNKPLAELSETKKRMILWPRGVFKTTAVRVKIVQTVLNYPNCRILLGAASGPLGRVQLQSVKRIFENPSKRFRELYPDYCGHKLGNMSRFTVPNRSDYSSPEETVTASTANSVKAGSHYDFVFIDDLVNDQNYRNPNALEQCWFDYLNFGPLRDPSGYLFVTGTPYTFGDTYERIEEAALEEMRTTTKNSWIISTKTCWIEPCKNCGQPDTKHESGEISDCKFAGTGEKILLFPRLKTARGKTIGHTREFLEAELREFGPEFFGCQYECRRLAKGLQTFTDELIDAQTLYHFEKPMQENELARLAREVQIHMQQGKPFQQASELVMQQTGKGEVPLGGWTFIIGDLAYVSLVTADQQKKRDSCVFFVFRVVNGRLYLIDCIHGKWKSGEVGEQVCGMLLRHRPKQIWIEAFLGHEAYDTVIKMVAAAKGIQVLPLEWLPMENEEGAKVSRIGSVHAWLHHKKLWLFAGIPEFETLKKNLKKWPKLGRHDDFGDCLGLGVNAPHGVALMQPVKENISMMDMVRQKLYPNGLPYSQSYNEIETSPYAGNGCGSSIVS